MYSTSVNYFDGRKTSMQSADEIEPYNPDPKTSNVPQELSIEI
jgi:hypothetical protein